MSSTDDSIDTGKPEFTDNSSRPEDGDQSDISQDPNVAYDEDGNEVKS